MTTQLDLTPFGFTPTESRVYSALLDLGPSTGYAVAQATRLARANAYQALEGLVRRGAAARSGPRPARYRATDPQGLLARIAAAQGAAFEQLAAALERGAPGADPLTDGATGLRAAANAALHFVARAERRVAGVVAAELWPLLLPALRRARTRAELRLLVAGGADDPEGLAAGVTAAGRPTLFVVDEAVLFTAEGSGERLRAVWTTDPLLVRLGMRGDLEQ